MVDYSEVVAATPAALKERNEGSFAAEIFAL
jgi:hypothetical protein